MRKPALCVCENKDADQLCGNRAADQCLCFRYIDITIPLLHIYSFIPLAIFCGCAAWFVSDLVGNPENRFSNNEAHIIFVLCFFAASIAIVKSRDMHWGLLAQKDHKDVNFTSLRLLLVADGANPCMLYRKLLNIVLLVNIVLTVNCIRLRFDPHPGRGVVSIRMSVLPCYGYSS